MAVLVWATPVVAQPVAQAQTGGSSDQSATVASLFADFLHFSLLGRFDVADGYADRLLKSPDLDPVEILKLSEQHERSISTLVILINNSTIGPKASKILEIIRDGEHILRRDTGRILTNIDKLGGPPQTEYNAIQHLADSGEYAIPWMIHTLRDDGKKNLWPRVVRALPQIGKAAVNPLVEALAIEDENIRQTLVSTLGEIGYAQAVPYLLALTIDENVSSETKQAALRSVAQIEQRLGRPFDSSVADAFFHLAEQFYDEKGSVRADPRLKTANVWHWSAANQFDEYVPVPRSIFSQVMAMRVCERALQINPDHSGAIALWLAANIRRESRLGLNVESGDAEETGVTDPTRPGGFPRALYFTSAAGARYAHLVLSRAVGDLDAPVALGAIAALQKVAGPASLFGEEDFQQSFVEALKFPDLVVRVRTALAMGNALPRRSFRGKELVVPILANALTLTGRRNVLVIDEERDRLNQLVGELRDADASVIGETDAFSGLDRAQAELASLNAIFISTGITRPEVPEAIAAVRHRYEYALTPVVLMVEPDHSAMAEQMTRADRGVDSVSAGAGPEVLFDRVASVAKRVGLSPVAPEVAHELALSAARTLQRIAIDGRSVFDPDVAEKAAVAAVASTHEDLQIAAIDVLALLPSDGAQRAIAGAALQSSNTESLRLAAFAGLSESAKRFANRLDGSQTDELLNFAFEEPNLRLRTAASQALGALNIAAARASRIPLKYHRG